MHEVNFDSECRWHHVNLCVLFSVKTDDKYNTVLLRLVSLLNLVSEQPSHIQAQESIAVCVLFMYSISYPLMASEMHRFFHIFILLSKKYLTFYV